MISPSMTYRVDFNALPWSSPMPGVREKRHRVGDRVLRLVEYADSMAPHFCSKGHVGHIVLGVLEIEFKGQTLTFQTGDALFIPPGDEHAHRAVAKTPVVTALFVEDAT
jgi:ethanolamine utilization protein EutQ (cupin superfamily)